MSRTRKTSKSSRQIRNQAFPYEAIRARLIQRGTNLKRWAADHQFPATTVYQAARGTRSGVRAIAIRNLLLAYVQN